MNNLIRIALKSIVRDKRNLIALTLTIAIGLSLSLSLFNIAINGFITAADITDTVESRTVVSKGKNILKLENSLHSEIILVEETAILGDDIELPIYKINGDFLEESGEGFFVSDYLLRALSIEESELINHKIKLGDGNKYGAKKANIQYGELFPGLFYRGVKFDSGTAVAAIDVFKTLSDASRFMNNSELNFERFGKALEFKQKKFVYNIVFAVIVSASFMIVLLFFVSFTSKKRLIFQNAEYSTQIMKLLGFNSAQSKGSLLCELLLILLCGFAVGVGLLYSIMAIIGCFNLPLNIIDIGDLTAVKWYSIFVYMIPYAAIIGFEMLKREKTGLAAIGRGIA